MPLYTCQRCLKEFLKKDNYEKHLHRKRPCLEKLLQEKVSSDELIILKQQLSTIMEWKKELENTVAIQQDEIDKLQKEIIDLKQEKNRTIIENNAGNDINSNCNNVINNIFNTFVSFGKENFSKLNDEETKSILDAQYKAFSKYVEHTHLNDRIPEQQNILVSNLRSNDCKVIEDDKIEIRDWDDTVEKIINKGSEGIESYLKENDLNLEENDIEKVKTLLQNVKSRDKGGEALNKKIKNQIKRLLYQNRNKIIKHIKKLE